MQTLQDTSGSKPHKAARLKLSAPRVSKNQAQQRKWEAASRCALLGRAFAVLRQAALQGQCLGFAGFRSTPKFRTGGVKRSCHECGVKGVQCGSGPDHPGRWMGEEGERETTSDCLPTTNVPWNELTLEEGVSQKRNSSHNLPSSTVPQACATMRCLTVVKLPALPT